MTRKTLHIIDNTLSIWIAFINPSLYDINVTDDITNATYLIAEYDGYRYNIKSQKAFNEIFIGAVRNNPNILRGMRGFMESQQPELNSFKAMTQRNTKKISNWWSERIASLNKNWSKQT